MNERTRAEAAAAAMSLEPMVKPAAHEALPAERWLEGFTAAERQRLRYLRRLFELGKLTEFPRRMSE